MKFPILTYTILRDYENCPHMSFHRHVAKTTKFVKTPEMEFGTKVHQAIEDHLEKGLSLSVDETRVADTVNKARPLLGKLTALPDTVPVRVEYFIGMKIDGSPCQWDDANVWLRLKADVAVLSDPSTGSGGCWLIDWKTGNKREDDFELQCQAMVIKAHHSQLTDFVGEYFWFKEDFPYGLRYTLDPASTFSKVHRIYDDMARNYADEQFTQGGAEWPKRRNPLCKWCDVFTCENNTNPKKGHLGWRDP